MKYIAITLLLLNVAYFGYEYLKESPAPTSERTTSQSNNGSIQLLSEVEGGLDLNTAVTNAVENPIRAAVEPPDSAACFAVGPFSDVFSGQDTLERLSAIQLQGDLRAIDVATGESDYRVLIPPARSAEEAFRKLRELQASDIDSYVITQGEQALGISLGVFSSKDGAEGLSNQLASMGYESEILEIQRQSRSYWIEFDAAQFELLTASNWLSNNASVTTREMNCTES